jgi:hypothetical protein
VERQGCDAFCAVTVGQETRSNSAAQPVLSNLNVIDQQSGASRAASLR